MKVEHRTLIVPDPQTVLACETRSTFGTLEVRADGEADERGDFWGPALPWNTLDSYGTRFAPDAFREGGVDTEPYALLWMHDPWTVAGTLWAEPRDDALWIARGLYDDTPDGAAARSRGKSGSARGLSVGFERIGDEQLEDGSVLITKARLVEISQITSRMESVPGAGLAGVRHGRPAPADTPPPAPPEGDPGEAALRARARLLLAQ
jgi:HK97 family phage prohead protease